MKIEEAVVYLMYHELEAAGRRLCHGEPGYVRYAIGEGDFQAQLALLGAHGFRGLSVSDSLSVSKGLSASKELSRGRSERAVAITFDDGCETDLIIAAPLLRAQGFNATFYLVAGFLGTRSYLSRSQARDLARMGFEIGCHSRTHPYLTRLAPRELRTEMATAKNELEQIVGHSVRHFSCPGGRWSKEVARVAREAGYESVATSKAGVNSPRSDPFRLNRVAVLRGIPQAQFARICAGNGLRWLRLKQSLRAAAQAALGDSAYDRLRTAVLRWP